MPGTLLDLLGGGTKAPLTEALRLLILTFEHFAEDLPQMIVFTEKGWDALKAEFREQHGVTVKRHGHTREFIKYGSVILLCNKKTDAEKGEPETEPSVRVLRPGQ